MAVLACLQRKLVAAHAPQVLQPLQHTGQQLPRCPSGTERTSTPSARDGSPPWRTPPPCAGSGRSPCRARHVAAAQETTRDRTCSSALPSAASFSRRCTTAASAPSCMPGQRDQVGVAPSHSAHLLVRFLQHAVKRGHLLTAAELRERVGGVEASKRGVSSQQTKPGENVAHGAHQRGQCRLRPLPLAQGVACGCIKRALLALQSFHALHLMTGAVSLTKHSPI